MEEDDDFTLEQVGFVVPMKYSTRGSRAWRWKLKPRTWGEEEGRWTPRENIWKDFLKMSLEKYQALPLTPDP